MPVHLVITRRVKAGCEEEFQRALLEFLQASFSHQAVLGGSLLIPPPGSSSREYGIFRSFKGPTERDAFYESSLFKEWDARAAQWTEGETTYRELNGLEAWFRTPAPPPRWKMATVTFVGVYLLTLSLHLTVGPWIRTFPLPLANALFNGLVVVGLTWLVMPQLTRVFRRWLHAK